MQNIVKANPQGIECVGSQEYEPKRENEIEKDSTASIQPASPERHPQSRP
jgi:hypothetical protein